MEYDEHDELGGGVDDASHGEWDDPSEGFDFDDDSPNEFDEDYEHGGSPEY